MGDFNLFFGEPPTPQAVKAISFRWIRNGSLSVIDRVMDASLSLNSKNQTISGQVADLSQSGMRVYVNARIARGTSVQIQYRDFIAQGIVWHSRKFRGAYSIGIEFQTIADPDDPNPVSYGLTHDHLAAELCTMQPAMLNA